MNKKKQLEQRKIYRSYHIPGQSHLHPVKKNAVFIANNNTIRHELSKCIEAIMLKRYGDILFNDYIKKQILLIDMHITDVLFKGWVKNECDFITEAVPNEDKTRRVDLVNISNGDRFEFETNKKVKKENAITIYI